MSGYVWLPLCRMQPSHGSSSAICLTFRGDFGTVNLAGTHLGKLVCLPINRNLADPMLELH